MAGLTQLYVVSTYHAAGVVGFTFGRYRPAIGELSPGPIEVTYNI